MKHAYNFLVAMMAALVTVDLVSMAVLVVGLLVGIEFAIWLFWYSTLFSTLGALIFALAAVVVFGVGFSREQVRLRLSEIK